MLLLPATVTVREARDTQRMLSHALEQELRTQNDPQIVVDASGLTEFDTAALAVLIECQRQVVSWNKAMVVRNPPAKLSELARLYGVDELLMPATAETPAP
jgi:phospholipid transport system transporter-binding protein